MTRFRSALPVALAGFVSITLAVPAAQAQDRRQPLRIVVEPRSFLDAGKLAPVGYYNRHLLAANRFMGPSQNGVSGWTSSPNLPGPIGAGVNPFANSIWTPTLR